MSDIHFHEYYFLNVPNNTFFFQRYTDILFCDESYFYFQKVYRNTLLCTESYLDFQKVYRDTILFDESYHFMYSIIPWFSKGIPWYYLSHVLNHTLIFKRYAVTNVSKSYISVGQRYFFTLWSTVGIVPHDTWRRMLNVPFISYTIPLKHYVLGIQDRLSPTRFCHHSRSTYVSILLLGGDLCFCAQGDKYQTPRS